MKKTLFNIIICILLVGCSITKSNSIKLGSTTFEQKNGAVIDVKISQVLDKGIDRTSGNRRYEVFFYAKNIGELTSEWTKISFEAVLENGETIEKSTLFYEIIEPNNLSETRRFIFTLPFKSKINTVKASKLMM